MKNKKEQTVNIRVPKSLKQMLKIDAEKNGTSLSSYVSKKLGVQTVEEKFLETFQFLKEENVSEIIDMTFEGNELAEIVKSKFEVMNKK
jgi:uncharacterized protein (DUF1778 family)